MTQPKMKINYTGIAALVTAFATAAGALWSIKSDRAESALMQKSILNLVDWRLSRIEKKIGLEQFSVDIILKSEVVVPTADVAGAPAAPVEPKPAPPPDQMFDAIQKHVQQRAEPLSLRAE